MVLLSLLPLNEALDYTSAGFVPCQSAGGGASAIRVFTSFQ